MWRQGNTSTLNVLPEALAHDHANFPFALGQLFPGGDKAFHDLPGVPIPIATAIAPAFQLR